MKKSKHQDVVEAPAVTVPDPLPEVEIEAIEPDPSVGMVVPAPAHSFEAIEPVKAEPPREDTEPDAPKAKHKSKPQPTVFRVARGGRFSSNGHLCTVVEGHIVRLSAYGIDGLERMKANGILLDPIG